MKSADAYRRCDIVEDLPEPNRENWLFECEFLERTLEKDTTVLQVGCMGDEDT